jgi:hypothetical protein
MPINPSSQEDYLEGVQRDEVVWVGHARLNLRYLLYVPLQANLYAYYGTSSRDLVTAQASLSGSMVIGPRNDEFIAEAACKAKQIIVAWGGAPAGANSDWTAIHYDPRAKAVLNLLPAAKLRCVRRKKTSPLEGDLHPSHPRNWSARFDSICIYRKPRP